ncbi:hypothetical protein VIGAN_07244900, partial [Vigna angularis var. angularis]
KIKNQGIHIWQQNAVQSDIKYWKNESALAGTWYAEVATPKTKFGGKSLRETEEFSLWSFSLRNSSLFTIFNSLSLSQHRLLQFSDSKDSSAFR